MKTIHTALILMVLALISACSTDNADSILGGNGGDNPGDKVIVHMTLSTAPSSGTRATLWNEGVDAENMKSWVVAFVKDNKVVSYAENTDVSADKRIQDDVIIKNLVKGETYQVYSFANLTAKELDIAKDATVNFDNMKWKMNGNGFDVTKNGIPMSNKQEVTIDATGNPTQKDLWVVRMLAKVTLKFKNPSKTDLVIKDITISDITKNSSENGDKENIKLLPNHTDADHDQVVCSPNLVDQATTDSYTYTLSSPKTIAVNTSDYIKENEVSFYVNESKAGNTSKYFIINLKTSAGVKRYALFQDWTTIARNDHHILQIKLDDYKLKFDVQSFSAIGLYPSIRDNGTTLSYTCYYPEEEFHIQPKVVKASDDTDVSGTIDYTNVKWELIQEDGMTDATAAEDNAKKVFKILPKWDATTGYFEGTFNDDAADKQQALYKVSVPVPGETDKYLTCKILFTKDLSSYAARKHYTRKYYRYE
ncbi:hypothetical protein KSW89_13575 [Prevotella copri]|uniref:Major fimbrial subunit protein N-terminal domain-containing protein n=2 Tax=Segatella copri TaxID=165179 RepID=A0AAW4NEK1_9BACT|nr:fimbrial protein [Segatella copri]MBU9912033.1 hypothetical protein [Segatella copri]MBV3409423.1 hypothetical protein [Segatella copri]MBV3420779.1 hypothetical protein [Segatella copri]MBV3442094.1 hypothetical protein [Segatella copri]MBV3460483.1 hypothetical protein [Segatella copri]